MTVGQVYDGPLDLLLDLIRKQNIDIYDIPIALLTAQFLDYCHQLKQTDVDAAGEFIYMASLLIHIKSKMLLPRDPSDVADADAEDPRRELVERLLEHERFKAAAQMLRQKQQIEEATWSNPGMREFLREQAGNETPARLEQEIDADTVDLVRVFQEVLDAAARTAGAGCERGIGDRGADARLCEAASADGGPAGEPAPAAAQHALGARADLYVSGNAGVGAPAGGAAASATRAGRHPGQEGGWVRPGVCRADADAGRLAVEAVVRSPLFVDRLTCDIYEPESKDRSCYLRV